MSLMLLKAMMSHPSGKGFFHRFGGGGLKGNPKRRSRHIKSQMGAMSKGRFSGKGARFGL